MAMNSNNIKSTLLNSANKKEDMAKAIEKGSFYVVALPCLSGYSIGCMDDDVPALFGTKSEAEAENNDMCELYETQIKNAERDPDDSWEGDVFEARWDCVSQNMAFYVDDSFLYQGDWKDLSGL